MVILNGDLIFLRSLEANLAGMLKKNELSNAASVRESKYIPKAIDSAQDTLDSGILVAKERSVIEEILLELDTAYKDCTICLGQTQHQCDFISNSKYEDELIALETRIRGRLLPQVHKMLSDRPLIVTRKRKEHTGQSKTESKQNKQKREPLAINAATVLDILKALPEHRGLKGKEILDRLEQRDPPIIIDQSTLTKNIIPALRAYGVKNKRGAGYYISE